MPRKPEDEVVRLTLWLTAIAESPEGCGHEMKEDAQRALALEDFPNSHPLAKRVRELHGTRG